MKGIRMYSIFIFLMLVGNVVLGADLDSMYYVSKGATFAIQQPITLKPNTQEVYLTGDKASSEDHTWCSLIAPTTTSATHILSTANVLEVIEKPRRVRMEFHFNQTYEPYEFDVYKTVSVELNTVTKYGEKGWLIRCNNVVEKFHYSTQLGKGPSTVLDQTEPTVTEMEGNINDFFSYQPAKPIVDP